MGQATKAMDLDQKQQQQQQQQDQLQNLQCYLEKGVKLEPFLNQVGGHTCLLRLGDQTICKVFSVREHEFYKSVPAALREFVPQYRGVVSVCFEEDEEGNLCFIAYPLQSDQAADEEDTDPSTADCRMLMKMMLPFTFVEGKHYSKDDQRHESWEEQDMSVHKLGDEDGVFYFKLENNRSNAVPELKHNPWPKQRHINKIKCNDKYLKGSTYKFILLENLTCRHSLPCVLDLKLGIQQHGDSITEKKRAKKMLQYQYSTAHEKGFTLSGMQVYQADKGQLMFMNKCRGFKLTLQDFREALFQFFHSGLRLRRELFPPLLHRLRELQAALESCESYRFYSSSLLIIYDGADQQRKLEGGLSEEDHGGEAEVAGGCPRSSSTSSDGSTGTGSSGVSQAHLSPVVDVRMIDFVHNTCRYYQGDEVKHDGMDYSCLFGLQNFISIISELENHSKDESPRCLEKI